MCKIINILFFHKISLFAEKDRESQQEVSPHRFLNDGQAATTESSRPKHVQDTLPSIGVDSHRSGTSGGLGRFDIPNMSRLQKLHGNSPCVEVCFNLRCILIPF